MNKYHTTYIMFKSNYIYTLSFQKVIRADSVNVTCFKTKVKLKQL